MSSIVPIGPKEAKRNLQDNPLTDDTAKIIGRLMMINRGKINCLGCGAVSKNDNLMEVNTSGINHHFCLKRECLVAVLKAFAELKAFNERLGSKESIPEIIQRMQSRFDFIKKD